MTSMDLQREILEQARSWLGTPYMHQGSTIGQGVDCLGLIRGVWREVIGPEPEVMPGYSSDWGENYGREHMLIAARKWFDEIAIADAVPGDLLVFKWKRAAIAKHAGILTSVNRFIHAYEKAGVVESFLGPYWRKRIVAAFRFPTLPTQES